MAASVTSITDLVHNSRGQTPSERTSDSSSRMLRSRSRSVEQSPGSEEGGDGKRRKDVSRELQMVSGASKQTIQRPRAQDVTQISDSHRVTDFQIYWIMKAGVNAGLSNEGMMKQEVYKRKIFDKFVQTVRIDTPAYHQYMKETFPDQVPAKCEGVFFTHLLGQVHRDGSARVGWSSSETAHLLNCRRRLDIEQEDY